MTRTKRRRKVWVNEFRARLSGLGVRAWSSRKMAQLEAGWPVRTVCFVESRSGDVVLSREQAKRAFAIAQCYPLSKDSRDELLAILRGGR